MINVTKTFLPPFEEYTALLKRAWDKGSITNNAELALELEEKLRDKLQVDHLLFASNGTIVLQIALKALEITGDVITTPFSYVATTTALLWESCRPIFVDINPENFCIDHELIEKAITPNTQAILATHVYGYPCNVEGIEAIAKRHGLLVIYDAAHAFGTYYKGKSIFNYGDVSTCSFHATKIYHTGEGGCITTHDAALAQKMLLYRQFGHIGDQYFSMGINAKNSEMHAAMGLCNLNYIEEIFQSRKSQWLYYADKLKERNFQFLKLESEVTYNYAYFPLVFPSEEDLLQTLASLNEEEIFPRRYFRPALNKLPYVIHQPCPVAESIASRVLCLPLYYGLETAAQERIVDIILQRQLLII